MMQKTLFSTLFLLFTIQASAVLSVSTSVVAHSNCGRANGRASAFASGGLPPYTYSWNGGIDQFGTQIGLAPGTYTVTVIDAALEQASADVVIDQLDGYGTSFEPYGNGGIGASYCTGELVQHVRYTGNSITDPYEPSSPYGPGPYSYEFGNGVSSYSQVVNCIGFNGVTYDVIFIDATPGSMVTLNYSDQDGCPGTAMVTVPPPFDPPNMQILNITPSCQNDATGTLNVSVTGTANKIFGLYVRPVGEPLDCVAGASGSLIFDGFTNDGLKTFDGLPPGDLELVWTTDPSGYSEMQDSPVTACEGVIPFTVPLVPTDCGSLRGTVYIDDDANCTLNSENRIPSTIMRVDPGPIYLVTDGAGQYNATLPYGSYTITEQHPVFVQSCPADVTLSTPATQLVNTGCAGGMPLDAMVSLTSGPARPGFEMQYGIGIRNLTPSSTGTVTLTLEVDPVLGFLSSTPAPTSVTGNLITWTTPDLTLTQPFQSRSIQVRFQVPPDVTLIGTTLPATAALSTANTDAELSNNTNVHGVVVTGSFDPNDKLAVTSNGNTSMWQIDEDEWIDYTIRFQNTGTDTAFTVLITDTLPETLDPGSIIVGAASHNFTWELRDQGTLKFYFSNILMPDSNVNEPRSHGFASFRIKPHEPVLPGSTIENTANIYFDFNEPVITEPSVLVAEFSTSLSVEMATRVSVFPNPTSGILKLSAGGVIESVEVFAMDGRRCEILGTVKSSTIDFDLTHLEAGAYLLRLLDSEQRQQIIPILLSH